MGYNLKTALSAAALALGLAASPAFAQMFGAPASGGVMAGGGFGGGHGGGFGGGRVGAQVYAPQFQGPAAIPRAYVPQGLPGGGIVAPRVHPQVGGSNWATGGVAIAPQRPRVWSPRGVVAAPHDTAQSMYVGGIVTAAAIGAAARPIRPMSAATTPTPSMSRRRSTRPMPTTKNIA